MKKIAVCVLALLFLTGCGSGIVLPDEDEISRVTVSGNGAENVIGDRAKIRELLQEICRAQDAGTDSTRDRPEEDGVLQVDFTFWKGGVSTLFLREEDGKIIVEQPFERLYEADKDLLNLLW